MDLLLHGIKTNKQTNPLNPKKTPTKQPTNQQNQNKKQTKMSKYPGNLFNDYVGLIRESKMQPLIYSYHFRFFSLTFLLLL